MRHIWASAPARCLLNLVVSALDLKFSAIAVMESAWCCLWRPLVLAPQCWYNAVYSQKYVYVLWTRAGRRLPSLAKISFAAGLLASGGWNKNDSLSRQRVDTIASFCQSGRPFLSFQTCPFALDEVFPSSGAFLEPITSPRCIGLNNTVHCLCGPSNAR